MRAQAQTQKARFVEMESNLTDQEKEFDELEARYRALNLDKMALETVSVELQAKMTADNSRFSSIISDLKDELDNERSRNAESTKSLQITIEELKANVAQQARSLEKQATKRKAAEGAREGLAPCLIFVCFFFSISLSVSFNLQGCNCALLSWSDLRLRWTQTS